ncbi:hypothetical protein DID74_00985 [Candidatus Marinamargulisbacteria bacterium SCGC AG-333-B06]|nr:hypothetical protein DID74_00985 [Candidatus Marinamargulisbacteria bacterium SCGC AG-333-B06]
MNSNMSTHKSITSGRRKAAILLMYLDSKAPGLSQQLFSKMGESRSKILLHEINHLGKIDKNEINKVINEFYEVAITQNSVIGGKNVTDKLLKDSFGIEDPDDFFSSKSGLFEFINHMPDNMLIDYLQKENLQVASLVLSLISDERSAKLLSNFPVEKTAIISKKMLSLNEPNYTLLWKFHRELELHLLGEDESIIEESQQIFKLSRVLEMMVSDTRKTVVDMISSQDKSSADKIQQLIFSFNDLLYMNNKDVGILVVEIDPLNRLAIALQGVSEELKEKILDSTSQRLRLRLEEEITNVKGTSEDDIQKEQGHIIQLCRKLEKEEKIESLVDILKKKQESGFVKTQTEEKGDNKEFPLDVESEEQKKQDEPKAQEHQGDASKTKEVPKEVKKEETKTKDHDDTSNVEAKNNTETESKKGDKE